MRIFIDSANINEVREIHALGFLSGVTTNPSLVAKEKRDYKQVIKEICDIVDGPISAEVIGLDYDSMIREGQELAAIHRNVVIKVPLTEEGLKAIHTFREKGIATNAPWYFPPTRLYWQREPEPIMLAPLLAGWMILVMTACLC